MTRYLLAGGGTAGHVNPLLALADFIAGAHIDVLTPAGMLRQYSIVSAPGEINAGSAHGFRGVTIAVKREPDSRGGSASMHEQVRDGAIIEISRPKNHFRLANSGGALFLAAGIGNIHGKYPPDWKGLRFDVLEEIQKLTNGMPLVLHGGTGIPADMIRRAISLGVAKINVNTECQLSFAAATRRYIEEGKDLQGKGYDPRKLLKPGADAILETVKEKIMLFGSAEQA